MNGPQHVDAARRAWRATARQSSPHGREAARLTAIYHATMAAALAPVDMKTGTRMAEWEHAADGPSWEGPS